ncbi:MAG TPA: IS1182 family transposase [candidate division Zixibacteria bacterium]|nr:IS1182 family transposase [candidate division Zixibacteria bacterium]
MSLKPELILEVPELTEEVARAAFPKGNPYLTLRDNLGIIFEYEDFIDLFPEHGQPALSPWRLALVTIMQFRENLTDRQAAEAVRSRIDWKYLLGYDLTDPGFHFSVLTEFRARLLDGGGAILLDKLLQRCREKDFLKERGKQRTDATHVLAAIRVMNRLELVGETMRAVLNALAVEVPLWLRQVAPPEWYERYGRRIEDYRLPKSQEKRAAYAQRVGEDGFQLLDLLSEADAPKGAASLSEVTTLRLTWDRQYSRDEDKTDGNSSGQVRFKGNRELGRASEAIESPYDTEARYRSRYATKWTGYMVHVTETCEEDDVHLITHVETTEATVHESQKIESIHQALVGKGARPGVHLVNSAYMDAEWLVQSRQQHQIDLVGPARSNNSWQTRVEGAYDLEQFEIDWDEQVVYCPQGKQSGNWKEGLDNVGAAVIYVQFSSMDCRSCPERSLCTRSKRRRAIGFRPREQYEALQQARQWLESEEGKQLYNRRAGIEGTISQVVRAFGLRQTRYRGLAKTHLQHIATAAAINLDRLVAWFDDVPRTTTRTSRFAALAPS